MFDFTQSFGLLADLGVLAGIVFLVIEIRQNNSLLAAQASYAQFSNEGQPLVESSRKLVLRTRAHG